MPRNGSGVYSAPPGTAATPNTTIASSPYNALVDDLVADANTARPVTAGGTGATNAADARSNLGLGTAAVVNTGTSGATIPLLNGANTWSAAQVIPTVTAANAAGTFLKSGTPGTANFGALRSSSAVMLGYLVRPDTDVNEGYVSTGNFNIAKAALEVRAGATVFKRAAAAAVDEGDPVTMTTVMTVGQGVHDASLSDPGANAIAFAKGRFNTIELGDDSDTTLARIAAGRASLEGKELAAISVGTFTPGLTFGGGSTGMSFSSRAGDYVKIDRGALGTLVMAWVRITLSAKGSSTGTALVTGLPFTVGGSTWRSVSVGYYDPSAMAITGGLAQAGNTVISLFKDGSTSLTHADFADTSSFYLFVSYTV